MCRSKYIFLIHKYISYRLKLHRFNNSAWSSVCGSSFSKVAIITKKFETYVKLHILLPTFAEVAKL
jgi:hypothetical protein